MRPVMLRSAAPLVAALLALLVGCADVPGSSDIQVVRSVPVGSGLAPSVGPERGVDPFRLVREFVEATGSPANGHAAARAFLSREAAASWDDRAGLTVIEDAPGATPQAGPTDGARRIRVGGPRLGVLAADGSFMPEGGTFTVPLDVLKEQGEWRITNPPAGVLVEATAFQRNYRQVRVYFVNPDRGTLVSDLRWLPAQPASTLPGRVLDLLLAGPSQRLAGAVQSALPEGTRPRSNVLVSGSGRAVINLTGLAGLAEPDRRLIAAQIVSTLGGLLPVPLRLLADGEPLVPGMVEWRTADIASYTPPAGPRPDVPGQVVVSGRLLGLDGAPAPGPAGAAQLTVLSAARSSPRGEQLAAVVTGPDGRLQLQVGRAGGDLTAAVLDAVSMTRPTWRPSGSEVWTVINGRTVVGVVVLDTGPSATYQVNATELAQLGPISELRLSQDGVRVAAVVGGRLVVAAVVTESGVVSLRHPQVLRESNLPPTAGVDWARPELLVVASAGPSPQVSSVSVDGLTRRQVSSTNLTGPLTGIAAAPGREIIVADATGLWAYSDTQEMWEPLLGGIGPGAVPLYPG
ncbi:MAG TPA: LpqB family beta-propeller domain-containing protein [Pseudonocardiaceae bacterium]|nr:LpqB family beta-propeller domain-containing protein [Pseudonocardiaceae bacterium]